MQIITERQIEELNISPKTCIDWVTQSFKMKYDCQLPAKISVHPQDIDFYTTMPCLLPQSHNRFGVKIVSRIKGRIPALKSNLLLYEASSGELLAMMDADWITAMRTGAVAALAINAVKKEDAQIYSFLGLGSTAHATLTCLNAILKDKRNVVIKLLKYKDQAEKFLQDFAYSGLNFKVEESIENLFVDSDVIVSAITETKEIICSDNTMFKEGVLVVPIHTRGFQNCDLFFDKVFADDTDHVKGFKYFSQFKSFDELSNVLLGKSVGRANNKERILSYNIGLGMHDVFFATKIYDLKTVSEKGFSKTIW